MDQTKAVFLTTAAMTQCRGAMLYQTLHHDKIPQLRNRTWLQSGDLGEGLGAVLAESDGTKLNEKTHTLPHLATTLSMH